MIIDIGCGGRPKGDVNVDLFYDISSHTVFKIDPRDIRNFIIADAHHLPIRSNSFDLAICYHILEHLINPAQALKEIRRIAKSVFIKIPNSPIREHEKHLYTWSETSIRNLLSLYFSHVETWMDSSIYDLRKSRIMRLIAKMKVLSYPLLRIMRRIIGLEICAYAYS